MASAEEHAVKVFSAVIPNRRDLLEKALRNLSVEHFEDQAQKVFFGLLERYYQRTSGVLTSSALEDAFRNRDAGQRALFLETYDLYNDTTTSDSEFIWSIDQLRDLATDRATANAIEHSMRVLRQGVEDQDGELVKGHEAAREDLLVAFSDIDKNLKLQEAPAGDMREERSEILSEYADRKAQRVNGSSSGVQFGIQELDAKIGGMQPGELVLAAGYSSDGKTTLCTQVAWSAAVEQGKNVVFLTTETIRPQVRRKLLARHSVLPQFGLPAGLNTRDLKSATLSDEEESKMHEILLDLEQNPSYGKLVIVQIPRGSTITYIEQVLARYERQFPVDIAVMDYLALLSPDRKKQSTREELASIMKEAKLVATSHADGRGLVLMSPWQVRRESREKAESVGQYTSASLSETAEATNSADIIISLLAPMENTERRTQITMQVLKNRDGETANGLITEVDYAVSKFVSRGGFAPLDTGTSFNANHGSAAPPNYDALLGDDNY